MGIGEFFRRQMSEGGEPSNNRVMLFLFLTTIVLMVVAVVVAPVFRPDIKLVLPDIPPTFETFVEWVVGILVFGSAAGKGINAYRDKGVPSTLVKSETITETKGATNEIPPTGTDNL